VLDDVRVPAANVVGEVGGFRLAMLGLNSMRPIVAARGIGLAEGALMYAVDYVKQRAAFGRTIADMQGMQWKIAELATEIEAARLLTYRAAIMADEGKYTKEYVPFLSMAKYYASEVAVKVSGEALQMLGAAGYMKDHMTELYYRDARQLTIVEGTSQVQLGLIARGVLDHDLWWD
jgi:alkylation response protein AidB-like acyl-CoA dehydrogenase